MEAAHGRAGDRPTNPPAADPWLVLNREIDRCRRYRHALALVRLVTVGEPDGPTSLAAQARREGRPSRRRPKPLGELDATLRQSIRSGDATWLDGRAAFILAPETDAFGAEAMGRRIGAVAAEVLGEPVELRIAAFPEHGLTGHALRARVTAREPRFRAAGVGRAAANGAASVRWAGLPWLADGGTPEVGEGAD
jgi:hypothetical protein